MVVACVAARLPLLCRMPVGTELVAIGIKASVYSGCHVYDTASGIAVGVLLGVGNG